MEYATVAQVRSRLGDEIADVADEAIRRSLDDLSDVLEANLGHGFGRTMLISSTAAETVAVTDTKLTVGGDDYLFATYSTLGALAQAINAAGANYHADLFAHVYYSTPSTLLTAWPAVACGPNYTDRQVLTTDYLYVLGSGGYRSHFFLPLPLAEISEVYEDNVSRDETYYWAAPGDAWLVRKAAPTTSYGVKGQWSGKNRNNLLVIYKPLWWNSIPGALRSVLIDAYVAQQGLGPLTSESFVGYRYTRGNAPSASSTDILSGWVVRQYAVKLAI